MLQPSVELNGQQIVYRPIGIIHTPFPVPKGTPIQPDGAKGIEGSVDIYPEYSEGLMDIETFSHVILIYHFHRAKKPTLKAKPFMDDTMHGIFAIRAPSRPNPIGLSVVRLLGVKGNIVFVQDVDMVDGTPLLDLKPYVPQFDMREGASAGWMEKHVEKRWTTRDDGRFSK